METRKFKNLGDEVSLLGMGMMRLPRLAGVERSIDEQAAQKMVDRAIAAGVNYFDTAWGYHVGKSEPFTAKALAKYPRDSYYFATKLPVWLVESLEDAERIFNEQLQRTSMEYFDYYLLHAMDAERHKKMESLGIYEWLEEKKREGKIRHKGFSFHDDTAVLKNILEAHGMDFVQIQLNYLDWQDLDAKGMYEYLTQKGIPVIIMEPVRGGMLASKNADVEKLLHTADPQASTASWAMRFAASLPNVLTVLSGMGSLEQLEDNVNTVSPLVPLNGKDEELLAQAADLFRAAGTIPCTGCAYCMDCPEGIDIPQVFSVFNQYQLSGGSGTLTEAFAILENSKRSDACVNCRKCVPLCPQSIAIPEQMDGMSWTLADEAE